MQGDMLPFFASLCLFLSSVEYAVPKPLPFMRLGLANLPVIFAVKSFRFRTVLLLVILKILLSSFISGTTFSYVFLFSAAGSLASGLAVYLLYLLLQRGGISRQMSNVGLCLAGALANNAAQILVARLAIFGRQAYVIAPLLLASGLVSALVLGIFANKFEEKSTFLRNVREGTGNSPRPDAAPQLDIDMNLPSGAEDERREPLPENPASSPEDRARGAAATVSTPHPARLATAAIALALMLVLPFAEPLQLKAALWLALLLLDEISRKGKVRLLPSAVMIASLTALALLSPTGKVLYTLGSFRITQGALEAGLCKGLVLTGMLFASQAIFASLRGWKLERFGMDGSPTSRPFVLVGRVFADFTRLSSRKLDIKGRGIISALDDRLCEVWTGEREGSGA